MDTYRSDFGRRETTVQLHDRYLRRARASRKTLFRRVKNGVHDSVTFYHLIDALLQVKGWSPFTAGEMTTFLNHRQPNIIWDSVTVGRVLADIAESTDVVNPLILRRNRRWNGMTYEVSDHPENRKVLLELLEDMRDVAEQDLAKEQLEGFQPRTESPMLRVPIANATNPV